MSHLRQTILILAAMLVARQALADKTAGTVTEVQGNQVKVQTDFDFLPSIGDRLEVVVDSSGKGVTIVGTLVVEDLQSDHILTKIERAASPVQKGQKIRAAICC